MAKSFAVSDTLIFIDSNIYLRFYDSNQSNFKQLLKSLVQLKDRIFVTRQIVDEVTRNKCQIFQQTFGNYLKQSNQGFNDIQLPEHLDVEKNEEIKDWNRKRKQIKEQNDLLVNELKTIYQSTFLRIVSSTDEVSIGLNKVFKNAVLENKEELEKAFKRKEIGNPPGKHSDTVGDQINWEQLISKVRVVKKLIIISNDFDYFVDVEDKLMLNPFLKGELISANPLLEISCFNKLSNGLKSIQEHQPNNSLNLPKKEILKQIIIEEPELHFTPQFLLNANDVSTIYYDKNHKLTDELTRLNYMYRHAMLSTEDLKIRLRELGANENKIDQIIAHGGIYYSNADFFSDFF